MFGMPFQPGGHRQHFGRSDASGFDRGDPRLT
jgi:hypothetical protein